MTGLARQKKPPALLPRERWQAPSVMQVDQLVTELGGGDYQGGTQRFMALVAVAAVSDERLDHLLAAAVDPDTATFTCGELVMAVGLRPGEVLKIVKDAALVVGQAKSIQVLAQHLPAIAADVATRAQVHWVPCGSCGATGWVTPKPTKDDPTPAAEPCRSCGQTGQIRMEADLDRQQLVFEAARLLPKGPGTNIAISNNNVPGAGGGSQGSGGNLFTQMVRASAEILHRGARAEPAQDPAAEADIAEGVVLPSAAETP